MSEQTPTHAADSSRLWLVTAAILVILAVFVDGYILHLYARTFSDFSQDYEAAAALRAGASIYDPGFSKQNNHPPFVALFFVPLTFFSAPTAFMIWGILSAGVYLWILWQVGNTLGIVLPLAAFDYGLSVDLASLHFPPGARANFYYRGGVCYGGMVPVASAA